MGYELEILQIQPRNTIRELGAEFEAGNRIDLVRAIYGIADRGGCVTA